MVPLGEVEKSKLQTLNFLLAPIGCIEPSSILVIKLTCCTMGE